MEPINIRKVEQYDGKLRLMLDASHRDISTKLKAQRERKRHEASKGSIPAFLLGCLLKWQKLSGLLGGDYGYYCGQGPIVY